MITIHPTKVEDFHSEQLFHAMLCDPPYELSFMGKNWDRSGISFQAETWRRLKAYLYPGAFGAALAGWDEIVGIEMSAEYCDIARKRIEYHCK